MRKQTNKTYLCSGYIVTRGKNLVAACAAQADILDYVKSNSIKIPRKAWWCTIEGVTSIETRQVYGLDSRIFKGYVNYLEEKEI